MSRPRIAIVTTHPIQYYSPWFAQMSETIDLTVYYAHRQTPAGQAAAGFKTAFQWDLPLLEGYDHLFLQNVARRPGLGHFFGCNTPEITKIVAGGGFDALLTIGWNKLALLQAWRGAWMARIPILVRLDNHLAWRRDRLRQLAKRALHGAVLPVVADYLSPGVLCDAYLRHYGVPNRRIHRLPHMVDVERFRAGATAARASGRSSALRAEQGEDPDTRVFLFVGKMIARKRPFLIAEALACLVSEHKVALWIAGDGPLDEAVATRAVTLGLTVRRLGFVNQRALPDVYAAADCMVLVSTDETWGLVVNEAQACGLPVIVSEEVGCAPDLVDDEVTGWTLHSNRAEDLARLMERAAAVCRTLPRAAIERKASASSYAVGTAGLLDVLATITSRRAAGRDTCDTAATSCSDP